MPDEAIKITLLLEAEGSDLEIRAEAPSGEGKAQSPLPSKDLLDEVTDANVANLPNALLEKVGRTLYDAIAVGEVQDLLFDTLQDASDDRKVVQVEFRFDADQVDLTAYPWEMICNSRGQFLVRDGLIDLTR